jgi:hypothetical protein
MPNMHSHYLVRNLKSTSGRACACGSWIQHWRNETGSKRQLCAALGCTRDAIHGAHVYLLDNRHDWSWWIVPLCASCNHWRNDREMYIDCRVELVPANTQITGCYR